jgi:ligand-binding SRPBCC domain-containing protein
MAVITILTTIRASPEQCFDASRNLDLHIESMGDTGERAVAGRTSGLIELGEQVTWEARHFGIRQRFTSHITAYDRPRHFQDSMLRGAFASFVHDHYFEPCAKGTLMKDVLTFHSPFGIIGSMVDRIVMTKYLTSLLTRRNAIVKAALERA